MSLEVTHTEDIRSMLLAIENNLLKVIAVFVCLICVRIGRINDPPVIIPTITPQPHLTIEKQTLLSFQNFDEE
jgi:hypothetical protein